MGTVRNHRLGTTFLNLEPWTDRRRDSSKSCFRCDPNAMHPPAQPQAGSPAGRPRAHSGPASGQRGWKWQPAGGFAGGRHVPLQADDRAGAVRVHLGDRGEQGPGVGVARVPQDLVHGPRLDDAAQVHDRDLMGQVGHHREVVGDEQVGEPAVSCRSLSRLRIWAWTETSRALVGSSQTMTLGSTARARAMQMRWRWPPENSWG